MPDGSYIVYKPRSLGFSTFTSIRLWHQLTAEEQLQFKVRCGYTGHTVCDPISSLKGGLTLP